MYKNIRLDFNGTLIDDCDLCLDILNILTAKNNLPHVSKRQYKEIFGFPVINYYRTLGFDTSVDAFKEIAETFHYNYDLRSNSEVKLFNDVVYVLEYLKTHNYKLICLSASRIEILEKQLKFYNIYDYFDAVIGLSDKYANSKVDVAINYIKENNINVNETLFIGDSIHDKEVADSINVDCYLVSTGHTAKHRLLKETDKVFSQLKDVLNNLK